MAEATYPAWGNTTPEACARRERHWRQVVKQWYKSGLSRLEFARREGVSAVSLRWWANEIPRRDQGCGSFQRKKSPSPAIRARKTRFIPVRVVEATSASSPAALEIVAGEHVVRVRPGFDEETLKRLVALLEDRP